ncbi:MAG: hypothetical protein II625_06590, partial [Bacilli bacterium]|nr:hypothetical protein [Bacilli bacterium]
MAVSGGSTVQYFQQTIWSKAIQKDLETITSLRNHCDFQYEKDSKNAKEIKILGVTRPTIRTYVSGTALTRESVVDTSQTLQINQYKYFNFEVEDIDKAQSVPGLLEATIHEASLGLAEEGDKYVASIIETATEAQTNPLPQSASVISLTKANAMASVEDGFAALYENNVKASDMLYLELAPAVFVLYRQALTELS